jgi:hypothetical protein
MSKKSRRRNKKLLAMLALAGGAAMMGRKKKFGTDAGFLKSGAAGGASLSSPPILGTDHIKAPIRKDVLPKIKPKVDHLGDPNFSLDDPMPNFKEVKRPIRKRTPIYGGDALFKKGGRVTGIAKRGFGRALMKGKK